MQQTTPPKSTPSDLNFWQIWNITFGFFGTQFGWALQMGNTSAIYEYLGANPEQIPLLWLAGPITGLIIQPLIGYWSDRGTPLGRRKPFFLAGAILSSFALIMMPNSGNLWMAAGMLWILDTSFNSTVEPLRAFTGDRISGEQRTLGFTMQAFFIGLGAVLGSLCPWIFSHLGFINDVGTKTAIPLSVKLSFYFGALVYLSCVLWTALSTGKSPLDYNPPSEEEQEPAGAGDFFRNIWQMPKTMRQLAVVQFFTWVGMFCVFLYLPPAIARQVFGATDQTSPLYTQGIEWAGIFIAVYNGVCFIVSLFLARFAKLTSRKFVHGFCLLCGGIGLISLFWIRDRYFIFFSAMALGMAWASILSMPYSILADALPEEKMGSYIGIFNIFTVVPQICVALGLGWVMSAFLDSSHLLAVVLGGFFLIIAALFVPRVTDVVEDSSISSSELREEEIRQLAGDRG
ncbi:MULTISPECIES: MFS transporter [Spirulina sp. CCY15215]|uniref:MFS transporter n=1 Tax=Spirulina sp. CCY15215 TaxID=2767591 RepID=UPI00194E5B6B|nr:MFS transporter [Spirulina major]